MRLNAWLMELLLEGAVSSEVNAKHRKATVLISRKLPCSVPHPEILAELHLRVVLRLDLTLDLPKLHLLPFFPLFKSGVVGAAGLFIGSVTVFGLNSKAGDGVSYDTFQRHSSNRTTCALSNRSMSRSRCLRHLKQFSSILIVWNGCALRIQDSEKVDDGPIEASRQMMSGFDE